MHRYTWIDTSSQINISSTEKSLLKLEIESVNESDWYWVSHQGCLMLPVFNARGLCGDDRGWLGERVCNNAFPADGAMMNFIRKIFTFSKGLGNITIVKTAPNGKMKIHIDASPDEFLTPQYKFRMVVSGRNDTLFFIDRQGRKIYAPASDSYIMDGAHPHGLSPVGREGKLTLCLGVPWICENDFIESLVCVNKDIRVTMPENIEKRWIDSRYL